MSSMVCLRQVAFATRDLGAAESQLLASGVWTPVGQDRHSEVFGLTSHIYSAGAAFTEILVPADESSALSRFLAKQPDEAVVPYMLVLQDVSARSAAFDAIDPSWVVANTQRPAYRSIHLAPKLIPPTMLAIARPDDRSSWPLTSTLTTHVLERGAPRFTRVVAEVDDPSCTATRWSQLLSSPVIETPMGASVESELLRVDLEVTSAAPSLRQVDLTGDPLPTGDHPWLAGVNLNATTREYAWRS